MKKLGCLVIVVVLLLIAGISNCSRGKAENERAEKFDWNNIKLGDVLPAPESDKMDIIINSNDGLSVYVYETSEDACYEYISDCEEKGFTIDTDSFGTTFSAFNEEGYEVQLFHIKSDDKMHISLEPPIKMSKYEWPIIAELAGLEKPNSDKGYFNWQYDNKFYLYVGDTEIEEFNKFVDMCKLAGFDKDFYRSEKVYYADNENGCHINVSYVGYNTIAIDYECPKDTYTDNSEESKVEQSIESNIENSDDKVEESNIDNNINSKDEQIIVTMSEEELQKYKYTEAEELLKSMGFVNFEYRTLETEDKEYENSVAYVNIKTWMFGKGDFEKGDKYETSAIVEIYYYEYIEPEKPSTVFYSTNDFETATKGNTGVFSYKNKSGSYDIYWIINFDEGYVYWFTENNGEDYCDKLKIASGDLNSRIVINWNYDGELYPWYLHFKYKNSPVTLIVNDHNGFSNEFTTTNLSEALKILETKRIIEN